MGRENGEIMQCKDGKLFFRPPFVSFYASIFLAIYSGLYMLLCYRCWGVGLGWGRFVSCPGVFRVCTRHTLFLGFVSSRLLVFPILHLWTTYTAVIWFFIYIHIHVLYNAWKLYNCSSVLILLERFNLFLSLSVVDLYN